MSKKIKFTIILAIIFILFLAIYQFINKEEKVDNENTENINPIEENVYQESNNNIIEENTNTEEENINKVEENEVGNATSEADEIKKEKVEEDKKEIVSEISPSGFMGSSMYKVILYSNKEVYLVVYNGNGYEEKNKISEELIATNVSSIKKAENEENYGEIIITGGTVVKNNIGWLKFE